MTRKELHSLYCEVSSRCAPLRGIYSAPPSDRERHIQKALRKYREQALKQQEPEALTRLFKEELEKVHSKQSLLHLLESMKLSYAPTEIPDSVYILFITAANNYDCAELLPDYFSHW